MTTNQRRAAQLAEHILKGRMQDSALSDHDWHLLLLAGGVNKCAAPALVVAGKVMEHARRRSGYFAPRDLAAAVRPSRWSEVQAGNARVCRVPAALLPGSAVEQWKSWGMSRLHRLKSGEQTMAGAQG